MDKPVEMMVAEFEEGIASQINQSGLPQFCVVPVLEKMLLACTAQRDKALQDAKKRYYDGLEREKQAEQEQVAPVPEDDIPEEPKPSKPKKFIPKKRK